MPTLLEVLRQKLGELSLDPEQTARRSGLTLARVRQLLEGKASDLHLSLEEVATLLGMVEMAPSEITFVPADVMVELDKPSFGSVLKALRKSKELTKQAAAKLVGVAETTFGQWENDRRVPSFETIKKICEAFKVDLNHFQNSRLEKSKNPKKQSGADDPN